SLYKSLRLAKSLYDGGEERANIIISRMRGLLFKTSGVKIDYISVVDSETLTDVRKISGKALVAIAARIGKTRLIDNIILN
ncbi:MAG TPA: pantoate--beta-alanine ligase, partial [Candidatus Omnitrophica bacterium]|nr:pantoate--beta-alanine ligase [Candidatus Omnitrophota bacterium]